MSNFSAHPDRGRSSWREIPVLLVVALLAALVVRTFVLQVYSIPSGSMVPTLEVGDRIAVEKLTYLARGPERGEVVVFELRGQVYVKRVIGLPGESVEITDGFVFVDGVRVDEPWVQRADERSFDPVDVPDGELYVLGDNRPDSGDSRLGLGFVPVEVVVGRAIVVLWPLDRVGLLTG